MTWSDLANQVKENPVVAAAVPTVTTFIGMLGIQSILTHLSLIFGLIMTLLLIRGHAIKNKNMELEQKLLEAKLREQERKEKAHVELSNYDRQDT